MPKSRHRNKKHSMSNRQRKLNQIIRTGEQLNEDMVKAAAQMAADAQLPDKERGLYPKYAIRRMDGSTDKGKKHAKCEFFILDLTHDPHAIPAVFSYARSAEADGFVKLAHDLYGKIQPYIKELNAQADAAAGDQTGTPSLADADIASMTDAELCTAITTYAWEDLPIASDSGRVVSEMLDRFEKLTAKPKRKPAAKKKPVMQTPPFSPEPDPAAPAIVTGEQVGVGICPVCNRPVGSKGDSLHTVTENGAVECHAKSKVKR